MYKLVNSESSSSSSFLGSLGGLGGFARGGRGLAGRALSEDLAAGGSLAALSLFVPVEVLLELSHGHLVGGLGALLAAGGGHGWGLLLAAGDGFSG